MLDSTLQEARRQVEICNACRYCEGYCAVFPAIARQRAFSDGDLTQLANLCHNCRGCYYACQFTEPHEFDLNVPKVLAEVRQDSWEAFAVPSGLARLFQRNGVMIALALVVALAALFLVARYGQFGSDEGGFYRVISHSVMVAIFAPAFLFPIASLAVSAWRYWRFTGGGAVAWSDMTSALHAAASMKYLAGGHGDGCNFEDEDRFSNARRWSHHAVMYGFLLCFASTSAGTILHYGFNAPAPYEFWSIPKLLGIPGGLLMSAGCVGLIWLKLQSDKNLSDASAWGGEMAFVLLLLLVGVSGLALYALRGGPFLTELLALHLGAVLAFFLLMPFSKMAHGLYRIVALTKDVQIARLKQTASK